MHRKDTIIDDAVVDIVEEAREIPMRLHPQFALWLARGFLCIVFGTGALLVRSGFSIHPPVDVHDAAHSAAAAASATTPARLGGNAEAITMAALLPDMQSRPSVNAVLIPTLPRATPRPDTREMSRAPESEDLVIEPDRTPKARSIDGAKTRFQRPTRRMERSARAIPQPLTAIARGARRTVRGVGFVVSRLF